MLYVLLATGNESSLGRSVKVLNVLEKCKTI